MTPSATLQKLGSGLYATVYRQEDGTVLKVSKGQDASMDYIEWCYLRMQKYGKGSVEMHQFPEVEHFGRVQLPHKDRFTGEVTEKDGWWAVMPEYVESQKSPKALKNGGVFAVHTDYIFEPDISSTTAFIKRNFSNDGLDLHSGNVMWDVNRNDWVVTDPLSCKASGTGSTLPQGSRFRQRKVANWKRSPLQCLYQRL